MAKLADPVLYTVPTGQQTTTVKAGVSIAGSILHASMTQFAGLVTQVNGDETYDLVVFPPNKAPATVNAVMEGAGAGEFVPANGPPPPAKA